MSAARRPTGSVASALLCLVGCALAAGMVRAQDQLADVRFEARPVADGIDMPAARGGNIGVSVGGDGILPRSRSSSPTWTGTRWCTSSIPTRS